MKKILCLCLGLVLMLSLACDAFADGTRKGFLDGDSLSDAVALMTDIPTAQAFTEDELDEDDLTAIVAAGINAPSAMNGQPWHFSVITDKDVMQKINDGMSMGFPGGGKPDGKDFPAGEKPEGMPEGEPPKGMNFPGGKPDGMPEGEPPEGMDFDGKKPVGMPGGDMPAMPGGNGPKAGMTSAPVAIVISCTNGSEFDAGLACEQMSATAQLLGYGTKIISSPTIALNGSNQDEFKELLNIPDDQKAVAVLLIGCVDTADQPDAVTGATERNSLDDLVDYIK